MAKFANRLVMADLFNNIDKTKLPQHVAVIMDGNGRWAKNQGEHRLYGHRYGVKSVREIVESCASIGIPYLTLYAFSTENWNRPEEEIDGLMTLLVSTLSAEVNNLNENNTRLNVIGELDTLPGNCAEELKKAMEITADNDRLVLTLALSYSSRREIVRAAVDISDRIASGELDKSTITEKDFSDSLMTKNIPDPDFMIRTSGEHRISNFLLYQMAYAELYFTETLWPDFDKKEFAKALSDFQNRERRYGKISEQINP